MLGIRVGSSFDISEMTVRFPVTRIVYIYVTVRPRKSIHVSTRQRGGYSYNSFNLWRPITATTVISTRFRMDGGA